MDLLAKLLGAQARQSGDQLTQVLDLLFKAIMSGEHFPEDVDQAIQLVQLYSYEIGLLDTGVQGGGCGRSRNTRFVRSRWRLQRHSNGFSPAGGGQAFAQPGIRRWQLIIALADKKLGQLARKILHGLMNQITQRPVRRQFVITQLT